MVTLIVRRTAYSFYVSKTFQLLGLLFLQLSFGRSTKNTNESEAIEFLREYNVKVSQLTNVLAKAEFEYATNMTPENQEKETKAMVDLTEYGLTAYDIVSSFDRTNFSADTKRALKLVGEKPLQKEDNENFSKLVAEMGRIYGEAKVCRQNNTSNQQECLSLEPDLTKIMADSRNASEKLWAWKGWRDQTSKKYKPKYFESLELQNKLALLNNYSDIGQMMRDRYEKPNFELDMAALYNDVQPLYLQLHAYIRRKLYEIYGPDVVDLKGTIPQHLLGDMWGRFWLNLYPIAVPFPNGTNFDVTETLLRKNFTVQKMFQYADNFFQSMGMLPLPENFYNLSVLEKPNDISTQCHPSAWDLSDGNDFRMKLCAVVNNFYFKTAHHELGHIQYYLQYKDQPIYYRIGANDGFHEAIGEVLTLSVSTPKHLHAVGLLEEISQDHATTINHLFQISLGSVSTSPFHYAQDVYNWKLAKGEIKDQNVLNTEYWKLMEDIAGVHPPTERKPEDFDYASLFHIIDGVDLIRYFTRTALEFDFYEALCKLANHNGPLHECDFYGSKEAGAKLSPTFNLMLSREMLRMGASKPWPDVLNHMTGKREMTGQALRNYFMPLERWLIETNKANGDIVGWTRRGIQTAMPDGFQNN